MPESSLIYLVDDDADYRYLVGQVFHLFLQQHRVRFFANGSELIETVELQEQADGEKPAAILLDIDMPQMDGFQTLARLKQLPFWQQMPVIMMTNRDHEEYRRESLRLGAHTCLLKPISLTDIRTVMAHICESDDQL